MTTEIRVRKGMARPLRAKPRGRNFKGGNRRYPWDEMNVNDSFIFPNGLSKDSAERIARAASSRRSKLFRVYALDDGLGCWRDK